MLALVLNRLIIPGIDLNYPYIIEVKFLCINKIQNWVMYDLHAIAKKKDNEKKIMQIIIKLCKGILKILNEYKFCLIMIFLH